MKWLKNNSDNEKYNNNIEDKYICDFYIFISLFICLVCLLLHIIIATLMQGKMQDL